MIGFYFFPSLCLSSFSSHCCVHLLLPQPLSPYTSFLSSSLISLHILLPPLYHLFILVFSFFLHLRLFVFFHFFLCVFIISLSFSPLYSSFLQSHYPLFFLILLFMFLPLIILMLQLFILH
ncbi:hypothetical protein V6Z11_D05G316600 [Gossypium hirsutum]